MSDHDDPVARGYRDERFGQHAAREGALRNVRAVLSDDRVREVYARSGALTAVAAWLVGGFAVMTYGAFAWRAEASRVIVGAWGMAPVVALVGRLVAHRRAPTALRAASERALDAVSTTGDDVADRRALAGAAFAAAGLNRGRAEGAMLVALSLMAPLSIHLAYRMVTGEIPISIFHSFNEWIRVGVMFVGHCHLALALLGWRHVRRVALADAGRSGLWAGIKALVVSSVLAVFPPVLLLGWGFFFANAVVAATGAVFVPLAWWWATRRIRRDRAALDAAVQAHARADR